MTVDSDGGFRDEQSCAGADGLKSIVLTQEYTRFEGVFVSRQVEKNNLY